MSALMVTEQLQAVGQIFGSVLLPDTVSEKQNRTDKKTETREDKIK